MKVTALVPAAGKGKRLKHGIDKAFVKINSKPLIVHTLESLEKSQSINDIVLVVGKDELARARRLVRHFRLSRVREIVAGGAKRSDSVMNGLKAVGGDTDIVLIHDGARPCVTTKVIEDCLTAVLKYGSACVSVPVKPTIKTVKGGYIINTPVRKTLWEAQTPQGFKRSIILEAYKDAGLRKKATDDSALAELRGYKVRVVPGDYRNIKVTTPEDIVLAEQLLK